MDNIFYNASHSDTAPAQAFQRPKHAFKGIEHAPRPDPSDEDVLKSPTRTPHKQLPQLPCPASLQHASPNHARQLLGLPSLPQSAQDAPRLLREMPAAEPTRTASPKPTTDAAPQAEQAS